MKKMPVHEFVGYMLDDYAVKLNALREPLEGDIMKINDEYADLLIAVIRTGENEIELVDDTQ